MIKLLSTGLLLFAFSIATAYADKVKTFDELDQNGDGYISKTEIKDNSDMNKNWTKADRNKDDKLDAAEFSAFEGRERFQPAEDMEEPEPGAAPTMQ